MAMNKGVAAVLLIMGCSSWFAPGFSGIFFDPVNVSAGEGRIMAAVYLVGAAIVWFMPQAKNNDER